MRMSSPAGLNNGIVTVLPHLHTRTTFDPLGSFTSVTLIANIPSIMIVQPSKTPTDVVTRLSVESIKALQMPDLRQRLAQQGLEAVGTPPDEVRRLARSEYERWGKIVKDIGLKRE